MANHNQNIGRKLGQNDETMIKDVAEEIQEKENKNMKNQSDIEAQIEDGYVKLKADINTKLTPIIQALMEAGVDSGIIASAEKEIHSNARMNFFNRVLNSDISNMEEIRKIVQKESFDSLKPIFEDGEIDQDNIRISKDYSRDNLNGYLLSAFNTPNAAIENALSNGISLRTINVCGVNSDVKNMAIVGKLIDGMSNDWFDQTNTAAANGDKKAKIMMTALSTAYAYMDFDKTFEQCEDYEQADLLININNLGRIINETGDSEMIRITTEMLGQLGLSSLLSTDESGKVVMDLDKVDEMGKAVEVEFSKEPIMSSNFGDQYKAFGSKEELKEEAKIDRYTRLLTKNYEKLFNRVISGDLPEEELKAVVTGELDAANRFLSLLDMGADRDKKSIELYNSLLGTIVDANLNAPDSFRTGYVMRDLSVQIQYIFNQSTAGIISPENLEKLEMLVEQCKGYIKDNPEAEGMPENTAQIFEEQAKRIKAIKENDFSIGYVSGSSEEMQIKRAQKEKGVAYGLSKVFEEFSKGRFDAKFVEEIMVEDLGILNNQMKSLHTSATTQTISESDRNCYNYIMNSILQKNKNQINDKESYDSFGFRLYEMLNKPIENIVSLRTLEEMKRIYEDKAKELNIIADKSKIKILDEKIDLVRQQSIGKDGQERDTQERDTQERDVSQLNSEQKKENMIKSMTGMTKLKGIAKSQEWMDNLITNYPDKELIAEAVVEFLEKQKESDEHFMDEDSKEARESVFESIVLSGIDNPEIFERMQKIDRETSKVVVKNAIEQVNSSRSVLNNVVSAIQALGKNLNEPEQEVEQDKIVEDTPLGFLNPEETELPKVDMFDNKRGNRGNEEPEDDWIR